MRVLYLLPRPNMSVNAPVGYAIRIRELIGGFERMGGEVTVVSAGEGAAARGSTGVYRVGVKAKLPAPVSGALRDLFYLAHDRMFRARAEAAAAAALPLDFIIEPYTPFYQTGAALAGKYVVPLILDDVAPIWQDEVYGGRRTLRRVARFIQAQVFERAAAVIAVSGVIRDYLLESGVPGEKIHLVPNGADPDRFRPGAGGDAIRERLGLADRTVVGFVGRFAPWHGLDLLLDCARDLATGAPQLHFLIVGGGEQRPALEQQVRDWGLSDRVTFAGELPAAEIPACVDAMDVAVMPDSNPYGSPIKIFEYMAAEKAVVAPRLGPIQEVITSGTDGLLFPQRDVDALKQALVELARDGDRRRKMGWRARQRVIADFTWSKHARTIAALSGALGA